MVPANSLAALVGGHIDRRGWTLAEAARRTGISYRQLHRIVNGDNGGRRIQDDTIDKLESALGIPRRDLVLAAYGGTLKEAVV